MIITIIVNYFVCSMAIRVDKVNISFYTVQELEKEGAKALQIDKGVAQHGPIELQEEDNYVMCKSHDFAGQSNFICSFQW